MSTKKTAVQIFIAYSQKDHIYLDVLRNHAKPLLRKGNVTMWFDGEIRPSEIWDEIIKANLHSADIILMLLSANALASDYFYDQELKDAIERHRAGTARVVPVVLSACLWQKTPLAEIQGFPRGMKPIISYSNMDDAWNEVVEGLWNMVEEIENKKNLENQLISKPTTLPQTANQNKPSHTIKESDKTAWKFVDKQSERALTMFIKDFPTSPYLAEAQQILSTVINDGIAWKYVYQRGTVEAYKAYLEDFPNGLNADKALKQILNFTNIDEQEVQKKATTLKNEENTNHLLDPFYELMLPIKGGTFEMGDVFGEGFENEKPVHSATVNDFFMCKFPVTQGLWKAIMGEDNNPSHFQNGEKWPVENVSWDMAQEFIAVLNKKSGRQYRLSTEVEWEYAARECGKKVRFGNGTNIADPKELNFYVSEKYKQPYSVTGINRKKTTPVDTFKPNALGLYDMSGNVWEWCADDRHNDYSGAPQHYSAWIDNPRGAFRVLRGGSWNSEAQYCRSTTRGSGKPDYRSLSVGFRLALSALPGDR